MSYWKYFVASNFGSGDILREPQELLCTAVFEEIARWP